MKFGGDLLIKSYRYKTIWALKLAITRFDNCTIEKRRDHDETTFLLFWIVEKNLEKLDFSNMFWVAETKLIEYFGTNFRKIQSDSSCPKKSTHGRPQKKVDLGKAFVPFFILRWLPGVARGKITLLPPHTPPLLWSPYPHPIGTFRVRH
jgi:hypothetical protein